MAIALEAVPDMRPGMLGVMEELQREHKRDCGALMAEIATLRQQIRDLGAEPVSKAGEEWLQMFLQAAKVMSVAQLALRAVRWK